MAGASPAVSGGARPAAGSGPGEEGTFSGAKLVLTAFVLSMANFIVVLDMTIANVSVPHISGGLAVSTESGTWVITSYAVAEAICVPLTGWLAGRFGTVRVFLASIAGFGLFSALCGISSSLAMLIAFRLGQGFCGGPLMPLSQTLLLRIFPKESHPKAMAMWAMTVVVAPIAGPILGGYISDNWDWRWIFLINVPIVVGVLVSLIVLLRGIVTPLRKLPIDVVGLLLLVIWVGAFQTMLDLGHDRDWFHNSLICTLAVIAAIFFVIFVIWELTDDHPIVDLAVFRHRGFSASTFALALAFATYFSAVVIVPQWLQAGMGYTATWAGIAMAPAGVLALIASPIVPRIMQKVDPRAIVFAGVSWLAFCAYLRTYWSTDSTLWEIAFPQLIQGVGMACMIVPLTSIGLASVDPEETASAAGITNFGRTLAGAIGTSVVTTLWADQQRLDGADLVASMNNVGGTISQLQHQGMPFDVARGALNQILSLQAQAQATVHVSYYSTAALLLAAFAIWLAPRPKRGMKAASGH
ncbi:DHA2 family efflux MFS transporter permease subunit [Novosphingobium sp. 1949]|uniref:DHA2 family efflux MFS transporter permease subunit n=1 Tax=Novosphingobium organovorum TaxID=2930092 RepID=A0ABT0BHD0_9SPHN|nr:DHA2 family efflux MFS transporter permease subunit [Novosphingobium organovorum]MCJ2184430.1 DHA2 family efflux MFS transporter permease subunit [Novosphingobium organovorum]